MASQQRFRTVVSEFINWLIQEEECFSWDTIAFLDWDREELED